MCTGYQHQVIIIRNRVSIGAGLEFGPRQIAGIGTVRISAVGRDRNVGSVIYGVNPQLIGYHTKKDVARKIDGFVRLYRLFKILRKKNREHITCVCAIKNEKY
ncbi:hypothetical protein Y032_0006g3150 [Ancylostoma ceylanicum]|nr:hypothetical protein Y032_0006g3150 [Ancylostoma ceylanicum]